MVKKPWMRMFCVMLSIVTVQSVLAETPVHLELVTEGGFPLGGEQRWVSALKGLDLDNISIRSARSSDVPEVKNIGTERSPRYRVLGVLTSSNKLYLPGARAFSISDKGGIKKWFAALDDQGAENLTKPKGAFGLTAEQLVATHEKLEPIVRFPTKGKNPVSVLRDIANGLDIGIEVDGASRGMLQNDAEIRDELQGISSGTAMAAILRPMGLVMVPVRQSREIKILVTDSRKSTESWPVGWPPQQPPNKTMPALFKFLNVEIDEIPLSEALEAIAGRLKSPLLFDYNSMARHQIEPDTITVSLPSGRTFYKAILDKLLAQGKLKTELRVDENGRAFQWISPTKR